jgi:hypothetical protein
MTRLVLQHQHRLVELRRCNEHGIVEMLGEADHGVGTCHIPYAAEKFQKPSF